MEVFSFLPLKIGVVDSLQVLWFCQSTPLYLMTNPLVMKKEVESKGLAISYVFLGVCFTFEA